ncbi:CBU_0592 family membrane protein [Sphingomonas alpina]|uniref:CBU-0592-like domain-containing protein n=1 Tax=Sphingomonas alpina TaxID=653931 RepID=A0A7H0LPY1_9SPHN|nr:hypothetical protein [Sphingomonas alpina]QNQ11734.1 hypothetical protein H3Z74_11695 [Sphingomonas alpina]
MIIAIEIVGWTGAILILVAYLMVSAGRLTGQSAVFQWMNLVGAACFIVNSGWHGALPSTVLNILWLLIGIVALWRIARSAGRTKLQPGSGQPSSGERQ